MRPMTEGNLKSAFSGESQANMRYLIWADKAEKDKFPNVARLFRAISFAEQVHATNHFKVLKEIVGPSLTIAMAGFGTSTTSENLEGAIEGENFEVTEMYPAYKAVAELEGERGAVRSFEWAEEAEKIHAGMYTKAKQAVDSGKDIELGPVQICCMCGYTVEGAAPDRCPVCNALKERFKAFE